MGIFGWSYPPGCSGPPEEYIGPCEVCGRDCDDCICEECPTCGVVGEPKCYDPASPDFHGLARTPEQIEGRAKLDAYYAEQAARDKAEGDYWNDPQRKVEKAELEQFYKELEAKNRSA